MRGKLFKREDDFYSLKVDEIVMSTSNGMLVDHKLSLKNCQAIELGYDLDELAKKFRNETIMNSSFISDETSFKEGAKSIIEILGYKKFTEDDVNLAFVLGKNKDESRIGKLINSRLQQTEWDVEIVEEQVYDGLDEMAQPQYAKQPKLDADGCLILKRK